MTEGDDRVIRINKKGWGGWLYDVDGMVQVHPGENVEDSWLIEKLNEAIIDDPEIGKVLEDFKVTGQMSARHYAQIHDTIQQDLEVKCDARAKLIYDQSVYVEFYNQTIEECKSDRWDNGWCVGYSVDYNYVCRAGSFPRGMEIQYVDGGFILPYSNFYLYVKEDDGIYRNAGIGLTGDYYFNYSTKITNERIVYADTVPFNYKNVTYITNSNREISNNKVIDFNDFVLPEGLATQSQEEVRKYTDAIAAGEAVDSGAETTDQEAPAAEFSLSDAFSSLWDWLSGILEKLSGILDFIRGLPASIYNAFASTLTSIKDGLTKVYDAITSLSWSNVVDAVISLPQQIWGMFEDMLGSVADTISMGNAWLEDIFDAVSGLSWSDVVSGITALPESIWEKLKGGFGNLADLIGTENGWLQQIYDKVIGLSWSDVVDGILALPQGIWDMLKGVLGSITEALGNIWDWLSKFSLLDILDAILGVPAAIWELFEGLLQKLLDAIGQICAPVIAFFRLDWEEIKAAVAPNLDILQNKFKPIRDVTNRLDKLQNVDAGQADSVVIDVDLDGIRVPGRDKPVDLGNVSLDLSDYGDAMSTVRTVESALLWVGFGIGLLQFFRIRFSVD